MLEFIKYRGEQAGNSIDILKSGLKKELDETRAKLDEERKASMVSNLLVVLCSDRDAQPIVNAGTLYQ